MQAISTKSLIESYLVKVMFTLLFFASIFPSCNSDKKILKMRIAHLEKEVMGIHDEVMPKMSDVLSLRKQVNLLIDSTRNEGIKDSLQKISYQLSKSDQDMMGWMHQYQKPGVHDSSLYYLEYQLILVSQLRSEVNASIAQARGVVNPK